MAAMPASRENFRRRTRIAEVRESSHALARPLFFIVAFAASSIVEIYSRLLSKRAKDLEKTVGAMLAGADAPDDDIGAAIAAFKGTSIFEALEAAAGRTALRKNKKKTRLPSYVSAKAFSDAIIEMIGDQSIGDLPEGLGKRLKPLVRETKSDLIGIKAGLERWFDETMGRLEGSYKRWATAWIALVGLVIAIAANASTFDVAEKLWHDPATREAVAETAGRVASEDTTSDEITSVAAATDKLTELGLPVGWDDAAKDAWTDWKSPWDWSWSQYGTLLGWVITALLVMLGAPFWFDVLTSLACPRSAGSKPSQAAADRTSEGRVPVPEKAPNQRRSASC
jgi:hypothetical protein